MSYRDLRLRLSAMAPVDAALGAATGLLAGLTIGLTFATSTVPAVLIALVCGALVATIGYRTSLPDDRFFVLRWALAAFALRAAVAAVLYVAATSLGRAGAVTGDDGAYADLAWAYVRYLKGDPQPPDVPPLWNGQAYLFGTFVYLESAVFYLLGREMLAMQFINGAVAALSYIALFSMARRLFGARPARLTLALVAIFPSLVLWSSLNLKEALVVGAVTTVLWLLLRLGSGVGWSIVPVSYVLVQALQSMRSYSFIGLLVIVPIGVALARGMTTWQRVRMVAVAALLSALLLAASPWVPWATDLAYAIENIDYARRGQAESARTAFVEPRPLSVGQGETLYVPASEPAGTLPTPAVAASAPPEPAPTAGTSVAASAPPEPTPTAGTSVAGTTPKPSVTPPATPGPVTPAPPSAAPTTPPTLYYVQLGTRIVLATPTPSIGPTPKPTPTRAGASPTSAATATVAAAATSSASPAPTTVGGITVATVVVTDASVVAVRPGDIVVIGTPATTPAPESESRKVTFVDQRNGEQSATLDVSQPHTESEALVMDRTFAHIPSGLLHAFFAPFPWEARRLADVALVPEMFVWYALLLSAIWTVWTSRRNWRALAPVVLYLAGVFALFGLLEGNVGTLYRHRTMLVPYVIMLAAPAIFAVVARRRSAGLDVRVR